LEHPEIAPLSILAMVTTEPAEYLQLGARYGALAAGQPASLTAIQLVNAVQPDASSADMLYESLLFLETQSMPLEMAIRT
jgi:cytosine/adenosine deaminase-related metal-dependent hydrolase